MSPILFLDIDGVLNAHEFDPEALCGQIHEEKIHRLNRVLRETGAKVVVSSAWRYIVHRGEMTLDGLEWLFRSHGMIAGRLTGVTDPDTMMPSGYNGRPESWPVENERGGQITKWLIDNGWVKRYAVVDDLDLGISDSGHPFVQTDGKLGLTDGDASNLIRLLTAQADGA